MAEGDQGDLLADGKGADADKGADKGDVVLDDAAKAAAATEAARVAALTPEQKQGEADAAKKAADAKAEADKPADYTKLKMPEGYKIDDPMLGEAVKLFGEHKLPADVAQKLVDYSAKRDKANADAHAKAWSDVVAGWQTKLKTELTDSKEFTGTAYEGDKLKEVQSLAAKAIDAYGGTDAPEIREFMKTYGIADHPAFSRLLARAGRTVREDGLPRSSGGAPVFDPKALYPNSPMN